jgi:hypothetical protein
MQAMFVPALAAIHNFISIHNRNIKYQEGSQSSQVLWGTGSFIAEREPEPCIVTEEELGLAITPAERGRAEERRDMIAREMWRGYQRILRECGEL